MLGFLGKILGKSKTTEKLTDIADKAFYTKQEQAQTDLAAKELITASKGSSLAIRVGFWLTLGSYLSSFLISKICVLIGQNGLALNISYLITTYNLYPLTLSFVSFYTGKKIFGGFNANKTMDKLANLEQAKASKQPAPKYRPKEQKMLNSSLPNIKLLRVTRSGDYTQGVLIKDEEVFCLTLEKAWRNNQKSVSCIPAGVYRCENRPSSMDGDGDTYQVLDVPNRTQIRLHAGNKETDSQGCILLGSGAELGKVEGSAFQYASKAAVKAFEKTMCKKPFILEIKEV